MDTLTDIAVIVGVGCFFPIAVYMLITSSSRWKAPSPPEPVVGATGGVEASTTFEMAPLKPPETVEEAKEWLDRYTEAVHDVEELKRQYQEARDRYAKARTLQDELLRARPKDMK